MTFLKMLSGYGCFRPPWKKFLLFFLERNGLYLVSPQPHAEGEAEGLQAEGLNLLV